MERNLNAESLPDDFSTRLTALLKAIQEGNEDETRRLLQADPRVANAVEESSGMTALHIASAAGDAALVELLLAHGANPNALDRGDNASPLHHAAERNRLDVVKMLVEAGADVNWDLDLHQRGPLGWAVVFGPSNVEVADYLVSKGAKFDLFSAIALGREDIAGELIKGEPALLRQRMSRYEMFLSPIEFATSRKRFGIAERLVELGSDVSLSEAAGLGDTERLFMRLREGVHPDVRNFALKTAVRAGQCSTARQLLADGADPNYCPQITSLLFDSIGDNDEPMSRVLIEFDADLEFKDDQHKSTPLGWQVFFGNPDQTSLAIRLGAKVTRQLVDLAEAGARGELRRWSAGTAEGYVKVAEMLRANLQSPK